MACNTDPPNEGPVNYKADYFTKVNGPDGAHNWNRATIEIVVDNGNVYPGFNSKDVSQILIQQNGNRFGIEGIYEVIIKNGAIQHQGFVPGGTVNGIYQGVNSVSPPFNWWNSANYWPFK